MKFWLLLLPLLMTLSQPVQAVVVEDLYSITLPIADQTTGLRLEAFTEAFKQVIVKVSGSDDALQSPAFQRPIESSARYVKQFRYVNRKEVDINGVDLGLLYLNIDFDPLVVTKLLRDNNFPVWGSERPSSLLVISYDVNERIQLVSDDTAPEIVDLLDKAAKNKGVPILFPLMDLEDISRVSVSDVLSRQFGNIEILAQRYTPDALAVGQIIGRSGEGWRGDWEVRFDEQVFKWNFSGASKQMVVDEAIQHLARILALEFALEEHQTDAQDILLNVNAMSGIDHLISVQKYLESLNVVEAVRVVLVSKTEVTYRLKLRNSTEDLQRLIEFGEVLEQQNFPQVSAGGEDLVILTYAYVQRGLAN